MIVPDLRHLWARRRLSADENSSLNKRMADEWKALPQEQKVFFQQQADETQAARLALAKTALETSAMEEADMSERLSLPQIKRLNHTRLDLSLTKISEHSSWNMGLALSDHISALRASLLLDVPNAAALARLKDEYEACFSYDPAIQQNEKNMPAFLRACCAACAGTCKADAGFETVSKMIQQFHSFLQRHKLGGSPFIASLKPLVEESVATSWCVVAIVALRPLCHTLCHMFEEGGLLRLSLRDGQLHMGTMHQLLRSIVQSHLARAGDAGTLSVEATRSKVIGEYVICGSTLS